MHSRTHFFRCALLGAALVGMTACQLRSPDEPVAHHDPSELPELPLRALGQEPGWILQLDAERVQLDYQYGQRQFSAETSAPSRVDGVTRYHMQDNDETLSVAITDAYCEDIMSGRPFPYTVEVTINDEHLRGCGGDTQSLLMGDEWVVETIGEQPTVDDTPVTLNFDTDDRIAGSAGCNRFTGTYEITGEGISVGPLAVTRRACASELMTQEQRFLEIIEHANHFRRDESGALIIGTYHQGVIRATR